MSRFSYYFSGTLCIPTLMQLLDLHFYWFKCIVYFAHSRINTKNATHEQGGARTSQADVGTRRNFGAAKQDAWGPPPIPMRLTVPHADSSFANQTYI